MSTASPNLLGIVITDFNGWSQTRNCLEALRKSQYQQFTTIVVDHGTTTETQEALRADYPTVVRLTGSPELWWSGATNLGINWLLNNHFQFVMLLNNDCYVTPTTIDHLIDKLFMQPGAIIAPVQQSATNGAYISIAPRDNLLLGFTTLRGPKILTDRMSSKPLIPTRLIIGGRGVVIPAEAFKVIGLFDEERLPHYGADHDFYLRCRKEGVPLFVATNSRVLVDDTRTTIANKPGHLTWSEFKSTLLCMRSHRNIAHVRALFRKHYPIAPFYFVGIWLFYARYTLVYLTGRIRFRFCTTRQR